MNRLLSTFWEFLWNLWLDATLIDYAHLVLAIVIIAWFISRQGTRYRQTMT